MKETSPAISEEMKEGHRGLALSWSAANLSSEKQILQVGLKRHLTQNTDITKRPLSIKHIKGSSLSLYINFKLLT